MRNWGLAPHQSCKCGALDQTAPHLILEWPFHRAQRGCHRLLILDDEIRCWLNNTVANIRRGAPIERTKKPQSILFIERPTQIGQKLFSRNYKNLFLFQRSTNFFETSTWASSYIKPDEHSHPGIQKSINKVIEFQARKVSIR